MRGLIATTNLLESIKPVDVLYIYRSPPPSKNQLNVVRKISYVRPIAHKKGRLANAIVEQATKDCGQTFIHVYQATDVIKGPIMSETHLF